MRLLALALACAPGAKDTGADAPFDSGDPFTTDPTGTEVDADGDGWAWYDECDDTDPAVNPDATEVCGGGDEDCDQLVDDADPSLDPASATAWCVDADGDTWLERDGAVVACAAPGGDHAPCAGEDDCDDGDPAVHPGAEEVCDNGVDDDCDGRAATPCGISGTGPADADTVYLGSSYSHAGTAVALMDVDGSGDLDLLVGGPFALLGSDVSGEVRLHVTPREGVVGADEAWDTVYGGVHPDWEGSMYGDSLAAAGDVDGDGVQDWLVSAPGWQRTGWVGRYAAAGSAPAAAEDELVGEDGATFCGWGVAGGVDVSGDGLPDWAVTCSYGEVGRVVVRGESGEVRVDGSSDDATIPDGVAMDDFDGDGIGDVVVGGDAERAFLLPGPVVDGVVPDVAGDQADLPTYAVIAAGDLDGDGRGDLLLALGYVEPARLHPGAADGRTLSGGGFALDVTATTAAGGDLDGDGQPDLAVADETDGENEGIVHVAYGPIAAVPTWTVLECDTPFDTFGSALAIGDLGADGLAELVVGAATSDDSAGATYVFQAGGL